MRNLLIESNMNQTLEGKIILIGIKIYLDEDPIINYMDREYKNLL